MFKTEYIIEVIREREYDTISIFTYNGTNQIDYAQGSKTELIECFEKFVSGCDAGSYMCHLYQDGKQGGGYAKADATRRRKIPFRIDKTNDSGSHNGYDPGTNPYMMQIIELQTRLQEERFERRLDQYKQEHQAQGVEMITALVKSLGLMKKTETKKIAGPDPVEQKNQPSQEEFIELFNKWQELDPDWHKSLRGIVRTAEKDPGTYDMAKNALQNESE